MEDQTKNEDSANRRGFVGKVVRLVAGAGIAGVLLGRLGQRDGILPAQAQPVPLIVDIGNVGVATTELDSAGGGWAGTFFAKNLNPMQGLIGATEALPAPALNTPVPAVTAGVHGLANEGIGVQGQSNMGIGVLGLASMPVAKPIVARGSAIGPQGVNLQEWQSGAGTPLTVVDRVGQLGIGVSAPLYALDLRTPGSTSAQMHFSSTPTDAGGYFVSASDANFYISGGSAWNGSSWVAKASSAYEFGGGIAGVRFFHDTGLTPGNLFAPTPRLVVASSGNVGIGTTGPTDLLDVNSNAIRVRTSKTPASASDTGNQGEICWDSNYVYVCVAANTWKRAALSSW